MKNRICLDYNYIFGDYFATVSEQARLYYIHLLFYADKGFVANPIQILDSMGYDKGVYYELLQNEEILSIPGRKEIFITSYFVHNKFNTNDWTKSTFATYWKGKLWIKENGVATLKKDEEQPQKDIVIKPYNVDDGDNDKLPF